MDQELRPYFTIREAITEDTEAIRRVQAESWLATYPNEQYGVSHEWVKERTDGWFTPDKIEESKTIIEASINDPNGFYRLAEYGGEIVGFVHVTLKDEGTKELQAIYVLPSMFGKGLGQQLIEVANKWINGAETELTVASYNQRAIRFYQKNGFEIIPRSESIYKDKIPVVKMLRKRSA